MKRQSIAVVIPTLNEASALASNLPEIVAASEEVLVSDGGSEDLTRQIAANCGARVVSGPPGRGPQLNRGARAARGDGLLFLHADTVLPEGAVRSVANALANGSVGGGFQIRFASSRPIYRLGSSIVNLRTHWFQSPLGDQAQFVSRTAFEELGGFPDWPILEDLEFMRRLKRLGKVTILEPPVVTSTRRFEDRGITRTIAFNWLIFALYFAGVSPERLARFYHDVR
ncbi:MAG: TIGR04283 family arsenosugar biosynthesis glycosyltransferase [Acidobacteria bacterium]|nr:TIGR04283 family arsenosugar biosynthesis glycosyltransferase [Acidobacteriota bacterium]